MPSWGVVQFIKKAGRKRRALPHISRHSRVRSHFLSGSENRRIGGLTPISDLIGRDCLTPQGDRVTVELIATHGNLPPHFIVTRFVYLRIAIFDSKHP